jgi:hypothetical protein
MTNSKERAINNLKAKIYEEEKRYFKILAAIEWREIHTPGCDQKWYDMLDEAQESVNQLQERLAEVENW